MSAILSEQELVQITRYKQATRQLNVLHGRGFVRAYIGRDGKVVLERPHYEAVCATLSAAGELHRPRKSANLSFLRKAA